MQPGYRHTNGFLCSSDLVRAACWLITLPGCCTGGLAWGMMNVGLLDMVIWIGVAPSYLYASAGMAGFSMPSFGLVPGNWCAGRI